MTTQRKEQRTTREHVRSGFRRGIEHAAGICDMRAEQLIKNRVEGAAPRAAQLQAMALELRREAEGL